MIDYLGYGPSKPMSKVTNRHSYQYNPQNTSYHYNHTNSSNNSSSTSNVTTTVTSGASHNSSTNITSSNSNSDHHNSSHLGLILAKFSAKFLKIHFFHLFHENWNQICLFVPLCLVRPMAQT